MVIAAGTLTGLGFVLAGLWGVGQLVWAVWQGRACQVWPIATGRLLSVDVRRGGRSKNRWIVVVDYEYEVDGTAYRGTRICFGYTGHVTHAAADDYAWSFLVGQPIAVRYKPDSPSTSVLLPGIDGMNAIQFAAGGAIALIFGVLVTTGSVTYP